MASSMKRKFLYVYGLLTLLAELFWIFYLIQKLGYEKFSYNFLHGSFRAQANIFMPFFLSITLIIMAFFYGTLLRMLPGALFFNWFFDSFSRKSEKHNGEIRDLRNKSKFD
jgi:hypothetical protein